MKTVSCHSKCASGWLARGFVARTCKPLGGAFVLFVLGAGCGPGNLRPTSLTPQEQAVQLFENGEAPNCTLFEDYGPISVESGSSLTAGTLESSRAKLKQAAAALGATSVRVTDQKMDGKIHRASGVAIKCLKRD